MPWNSAAPVRAALFGADRLEQHAEGLAAAQRITARPPAVQSLQARLSENAAVLLAAYRASAADLAGDRSIVPAADWLLDNYHLVEAQVREVREDLSPGYYRQLPKLADGPFAGYPRVFGLAWAYIAHTDSHVDPDILQRFIRAYQRVQPLAIGELWAVAITLRITLIENLRRLTDQIMVGRSERADADALADRLLQAGRAQSSLAADAATRSPRPLSTAFAAQFAKRLRDQDPRTTPALGWLMERLQQQGTSIEEVVLHAQQELGASNVSVRNVITSMRLISNIDWVDLFESVSLVDEVLRGAGDFAAMDFPTRNLYRSAIEELARGSSLTELELARRVLATSAEAAEAADDAEQRDRAADPGRYLIGEGRRAFERAIGFRPRPRLRMRRIGISFGIGGYIGAVLGATAALLALALWALAACGLDAGWLAVFAALGFVPASEAATALVNRAIGSSFGATSLPGLELAAGVPTSLRTLVAVPTLLTCEADLREQIERLEIHYLSGSPGDLFFALLSDGADADRETVDSDAPLLAVAVAGIARLNRRHGPGAGGDRFLLLHRRRQFNACENVWMGWERKRGKLHELNRLLRGATDTSFVAVDGQAPHVPDGVRFVITLDADTRLPRDTARRLVGKMGHPLNRPMYDPARQRITAGYAILQPRVTPALALSHEGSLYQRMSSGPAGMDPYAATISNVYQDLFGEGSYTGKGIYDVDAFEAALAGRVPANTLLSHDLFEGIFARAGLVSDIEVVEEFPTRYDVAARRQHRWVRGDWQLLSRVLGHWRGPRATPGLGRWKMLDNLRRSLVAPLTLATVVAGWLLPLPAAATVLLLVLASLAIPAFLPSLFSILPRRSGLQLRSHLRALGGILYLAAGQVLLAIVLLPDQAWRMGDAITRTLVRLFLTHRRLLEWTTAAMSTAAPRLTLAGFYRGMAGSLALGLALAAAAVAAAPASWPLVLPLALAWIGAPALAFWISRTSPVSQQLTLGPADAFELRLIARQTWRYFETFVTPADNMLPPDNFQEAPKPVLAHRTSPTNLGLYLLSTVAAHDFGWTGLTETVERLEATLDTMRRLPRFRGHFFNWYDTRDLKVLVPAYVSAVDSGNLAGHLVTLANACEEWMGRTAAPDARSGMMDTLQLARGALGALAAMKDESGRPLVEILDEIDRQLRRSSPIEAVAPSLVRLADKAVAAARGAMFVAEGDPPPDLLFWLQALHRTGAEHARDRPPSADAAHPLEARLRAIAGAAREMALAMDFTFLLDPDRKLLSIGYCLADNSLDSNCYDLLASEARLASLFAIAKGDVPTRHWFRLGRAATPVGNGSALVSWSGSMFEYLMPSLIMRAPVGSLLEQTSRLVVERQQDYGRQLDVPWGVSESAYNARDIEFTYQYSSFGVPGLGLKRGLADDTVIAPYATALAAMVDPHAAKMNLSRLAATGARGRYGFYEALDFTRSRLPADEDVAIVRAFMAHHQGMTIVALANTLQDGRMRARFHREPMIQASELLLQERMPREVVVLLPQAEEMQARPTDAGAAQVPTVRRLQTPDSGAPTTHLLANGRYTVMLTATGAGYSRWNDMAVTRWREDATRDDWGSFLFLRDVHSGKVWSASSEPAGDDGEPREVTFDEDYAQFVYGDGSLSTTMDVLVSGEDDGEVRRISLINNGRRSREIDITSYAEVVLATPAADSAHPAFSKMFVQTEYLPEFGALVATRRPRSPDEPRLWAAHFCVVEGDTTAGPQYETDRARFIGRDRAVADAAAIRDGEPLSNTVGTVLDPVFSLRQRLAVPAGQAARIAFWTVVAPSRAELLNLVDKHHDRSAFDRAKTLAWTQGQVQLRHLGISPAEAADFQCLATPLLYADRRFRASPEAMLRGAGAQSRLWPYAISGDLPLLALRIDDVSDMPLVNQLLRAHEYWRMKRLAVDLVIVNEHAASYLQDLQAAIETAVRSSQSRPQMGGAPAQGGVYILRADLMDGDARGLLYSAARVVLHARRGPIAQQLAHMPRQAGRTAPTPTRAKAVATPAAPPRAALELFNGLGGFDKNGREYVTVIEGGRVPPAPWINVIANAGFGFQVSAEGSGYTWAENSRDNQLTQWSNDPVTDPGGEAMYVRDEATGDIWSATAQPVRDGGTYVARHGFGYSRFTHEAGGIDLDLLQFVPLDDPVKISRLVIRNRSARPRSLSITAYAEWVLGTSRGASAPFIVTDIDPATGALLARNPWSTAFPGRVAFADLRGRQTSWTADRAEFLGGDGAYGIPAALADGDELSGTVGPGLDPCAALATRIELGAGETTEIVWLLGQCGSAEAAGTLVSRYRQADLDTLFAAVNEHWRGLLGAVQVKTPDRAMDIMLNGWLLYQTLACRLVARSAFYQASGAYGFRDQLQDCMALSLASPDTTRHHLLVAAARQFVEGDVQHWWLPQSGQGVRTRISDDRVWLAFTVASYVATSGDDGVLDERVPFLEGPALAAGEHDAFFQPQVAQEQASLFEHCARALDQSLLLTGPRGLPLMGTGDWNDGMNLVGEGGKGESVWLGWLLIRTIALFAPCADKRDAQRAQRWRLHAEAVRAAMEKEAWDGEWYRRATFDDGTWMGSKAGAECRIDSIAQSWAVLSGAADPARAAQAMESLDQHLIRRDQGLALLFAPPFDTGPQDPGYIKGYPPGVRENGGQYSHAAMWAILAFAQLGDGERAAGLFALVNPINHARTPMEVERYKVEPYVVAADIYSVAPHVGRGGWTWYTGSAAWMYRAGVEGILGIRREGARLAIQPCVPAAWPGFQATVETADTCYDIHVDNGPGHGGETARAVLDGLPLAHDGGRVLVPLDGGRHTLQIYLGAAAQADDGKGSKDDDAALQAVPGAQEI